MNISLEYYKVFFYAAEYGSLTTTAQQLCITQPAVSQAIHQLKKEPGCTLFNRGNLFDFLSYARKRRSKRIGHNKDRTTEKVGGFSFDSQLYNSIEKENVKISEGIYSTVRI